MMRANSYITYAEYLETEHWQERRRIALKLAGHKCQLCGRKDRPLEVHHNNYEHLFDEDQEDLFVLCEHCHTLFSEEGVIE